MQQLGTRRGDESRWGHTVREGARAGPHHSPGLPEALCNQGQVSGTLARNLGWTGRGVGHPNSLTPTEDLEQVSAFQNLVSSREEWGKSDAARGVSVMMTGHVWKGHDMRLGTKRTLSKWKQACSCPLSPLQHVDGNSESAPQLCSKVLDTALSGDRAGLPHPCVSPRRGLPAGSLPQHRGSGKIPRPRALCDLGQVSAHLLSCSPPGAEMRLGTDHTVGTNLKLCIPWALQIQGA